MLIELKCFGYAKQMQLQNKKNYIKEIQFDLHEAAIIFNMLKATAPAARHKRAAATHCTA